ncbi:type II secretion system protein [Prosthecobacter fluviatilis]|uniref:Type II secretion system protein n=1 Tax=Prosthecobacter fluviatilis TaxID=445931 RepID=A0ABW0KSV1_9BACT
MKAPSSHAARKQAFTLLEVIIVLVITALVLGAVYSLAQGTLTLADDVRRAERRDARMQAFATFCEHLLAELPSTATLNLTTTEDHGEYLSRMELEHVHSPFDETPDCTVTLFTQAQPGGGVRLLLSCHSEERESSVVLFEDLAQCEWRVLQPATLQWAPFWSTESDNGKPKLMKLILTQVGADTQERAFWITPRQATALQMQ